MQRQFFFVLFIAIILSYSGLSQQIIPYSVPAEQWEEKFGNHRAVIRIDRPADAVNINFLWRRHDLNPEKRRMMIINAANGTEVQNIYRVNIDNERCELVFGPADKAGEYYFYYLPYTPVTNFYHSGDYLPPEGAPDSLWVFNHNLAEGSSRYTDVSSGVVTGLQARTEFHSFYPMEVIATDVELKNYLEDHRDSYLVFPEDRKNPVRMNDALPLKWIEKAPAREFSGEAMRDEYYSFQLGIYASAEDLANVRLQFPGLVSADGNKIPPEAFTCFNTDGVDINGKPFTREVSVKEGRVQPMWVGVDIPLDAAPGFYCGNVIVKPADNEPVSIALSLTVADRIIEDRGDNDLWRHSRLRWLNSTLGIDDEPVNPYTPILIEERRVSCLGRSVELDDFGLPGAIQTWGNNILASPVRFTVEAENRIMKLNPGKFSFEKKAGGVVSWRSESANDKVGIVYSGEMEADGRMLYKCTLTAKSDIHIQDVRIELPLRKEHATYMTGMGRMGGYTPASHISRWLKTEDSFWIGSTRGGIQCELRGGSYHGPLRNLYQPDPSPAWFNGMNGGYRISSDNTIVTAAGYSGARKMTAGQKVTFEFALLITPVKDPAMKNRFTDRYFHSPEPTPEVVANGGNIMNVHHANEYNPYINYPFIARDELRGLVDKWHAQGWKVKIYYTVRELSNHLVEIWALRSLGFEVLADGRGGGYSWLREHLVDNYGVQWYTHLGERGLPGDVDAAILNSGESRWYNYYVEGLNWLVRKMDIDGLYLDDVSFDRRTLKRMRKVMDMNKPGCIIDLHSNTAFSLGSANQNLELYPYVDRTWFGEGFNFDLMPADFWLTEVSGIPFGVPNDILMHMSVNNRRGMTFGMTHRGFVPMWKLWNRFGISDAKMQGYWEDNPVVKTGLDEVYATSFLKGDSILVAIGNWRSEPVDVNLFIDWKRLQMKPAQVKILAPEMDNYQKEHIFRPGDPVPVDAKSDILLIIKKTSR